MASCLVSMSVSSPSAWLGAALGILIFSRMRALSMVIFSFSLGSTYESLNIIRGPRETMQGCTSGMLRGSCLPAALFGDVPLQPQGKWSPDIQEAQQAMQLGMHWRC